MGDTVLFSRYRLVEPVGTGGSAEVWRALDQKSGEEVAVKRLHPIVLADSAGRARLRREFEAIKGLREPHIVGVRDLHVGKREAALVLDYVDGPSVAQRLAAATDGTPAFTPEEAVAIVADVAAALSAAHAAGIVHRDVTPGNILLTPDGEARLTDFGIAHGEGDTTVVTATGQLMGTMRYLAPEQLRGEPSSPSSDLHSLAAVAYEMLSGRRAYDVSTPVALAEAQAVGAPPIEGVSPAVDAAVRQGLAVDPSQRPGSVAVFATALQAALAAEATTLIAVPPPGVTAQIPIGKVPVAAVATTSAASTAAALASSAPIHAEPTGDPGPDEVATASPSRAAATHGAMPQALGLADRPRSGPWRRFAGVPAPIAGLLALVLAVGVLAAASSDPPAAPATGLSAGPSATARPTPTPTAAPTKGPKGHGKDHGKDQGDG